MRPRLLRSAAALGLCAVCGGCIAYTVASTAVSVTATAVETTADIVGVGVDAIAGSDDDD